MVADQTKQQWIQTFTEFITRIGINIQETKIHHDTFLPGVEIRNGALFYDQEKLLYPGDLIHEAGHLALISTTERPNFSGNVIDTDANKAGDEMAVMLWTYAVCINENIPPEIIFHPDGYKDQSDWLMENYSNGIYIALPLLKWMTMTDDSFPKMIKWLRD